MSSSCFLSSSSYNSAASASLVSTNQQQADQQETLRELHLSEEFIKNLQILKETFIHLECGESFLLDKSVKQSGVIICLPKCCPKCGKESARETYRLNSDLKALVTLFFNTEVGKQSLCYFNEYIALQYLIRAEKLMERSTSITDLATVDDLCEAGLEYFQEQESENEIEKALISLQKEAKCWYILSIYEKDNNITPEMSSSRKRKERETPVEALQDQSALKNRRQSSSSASSSSIREETEEFEVEEKKLPSVFMMRANLEALALVCYYDHIQGYSQIENKQLNQLAKQFSESKGNVLLEIQKQLKILHLYRKASNSSPEEAEQILKQLIQVLNNDLVIERSARNKILILQKLDELFVLLLNNLIRQKKYNKFRQVAEAASINLETWLLNTKSESENCDILIKFALLNQKLMEINLEEKQLDDHISLYNKSKEYYHNASEKTQDNEIKAQIHEHVFLLEIKHLSFLQMQGLVNQKDRQDDADLSSAVLCSGELEQYQCALQSAFNSFSLFANLNDKMRLAKQVATIYAALIPKLSEINKQNIIIEKFRAWQQVLQKYLDSKNNASLQTLFQRYLKQS